ncbi:Na(+)/H(+) antiporter NhaA [Geodia barretti]|uniref:Na(+)/H(+) antiporter NhaA n=1 Tax=Geodia barretti TaxID=519541 RepID=A0AA35W2Z1_GEOBA|nr:Na(+)/H(+) antiporter NhaA [Geodia barretti]
MHSESTGHIHPAIRATNILQEFSLPLIAGVVLGLLAANTNHIWYEMVVEFYPFGENASVFGHALTVHFIINGMFMCLFFGIAAKEITSSTLPGGVLNPLRRAINPLVGTIGGVFGPAGLYLLLAWVIYGGSDDFGAVAKGWAIPTATDIALAWLVARLVFGATHPAVNFLLLLAVADDAIGLGIIAIFYPDPHHPVQPIWLLLVVGGMAAAYVLGRFRIRWWPVYILIGGALSWIGLAKAGVEPALALVPIVPFLPHSDHSAGLFEEEAVLDQFEHQLKLFVDVGLFFFAFVNSGVALSSIGYVTGMVLVSLIIGKAVGVTVFSWAASLVGFPLPNGMRIRHLFISGIIAGLGLTVALFVAGKAFPSGSAFHDPGKMGAVFSIASGGLAYILGRWFNARDQEGIGVIDDPAVDSAHQRSEADS